MEGTKEHAVLCLLSFQFFSLLVHSSILLCGGWTVFPWKSWFQVTNISKLSPSLFWLIHLSVAVYRAGGDVLRHLSSLSNRQELQTYPTHLDLCKYILYLVFLVCSIVLDLIPPSPETSCYLSSSHHYNCSVPTLRHSLSFLPLFSHHGAQYTSAVHFISEGLPAGVLMEIFKRGNSITSWLLETPEHTEEDDRATTHSQTFPSAERHME